MAWLSNNSILSSAGVTHTMLNNLANDIRSWGGNVNAGGYELSNLTKVSLGSGTGGQKLAVFESGANFYGFGIETGGFGAALKATAGTTGGFSFFVDNTLRSLFLNPNGRIVVSASLTDPLAQFHVHGAGQATAALTDGGARLGTIYVQDAAGAGGNGGAVLLGALNGHWCAIKGLLHDGSGTTVGHLAFSVRASTAATALTEAMRITYQGRIGINKQAPGTMLAVVGLPTYADNSAASTAGLTAGDFYRTSAGVLMVTY